MTSVSGLSAAHREGARHLVAQGCGLLLSRPGEVHYTQGPQRWEAIDHHRDLDSHLFPFYGDCSSTATFLLRHALAMVGVHRDIVNGLNWRAGYTGTLSTHGKRVVHDASIKVGDLVLYGHGWPYEHVTVALGGGMVFSHGSEAGPFKLALDYRPDRAVGNARRFI